MICTCGCGQNVTRRTIIHHLSGQGTKAALVQQQHTVFRKRVFQRKRKRTATTRHHSPSIITSNQHPPPQLSIPDPPPVLADSGNPMDDGDIIMADDTSHNDAPTNPQASHAEELADKAYVWNQSIHDSMESDEDGDIFEGEMDMEDSDEEDGWNDLEENDLPPWLVGLTADELVEEEFEAEAISRGGFRQGLISYMSNYGCRTSNV